LSAKKRRRRRAPASSAARASASTATRGGRKGSGQPADPQSSAKHSGADPARRERKEAVRRAKEATRKRAARVAALRRSLTITTVGVVAVSLLLLLNRAASPRPILAYAVAAARAAGCSGATTPVKDPVRTHLDPGEKYTYTQKPATSGPHDPSPWPVDLRVNDGPILETRAVHSLEHAEIILYYRQSGDGALASDVVDALKGVARSSRNTLLAPYPDLPSGESLALTAWNKLQTCPGTITAVQAKQVAWGFEYAFSCTGNAPESKASSNGC
jgi:hypothetical protein